MARLCRTSWVEDGELNTSKAYDFYRPKGRFQLCMKDLWKPCLLPKHAFILWLGVKGRLLTKDRITYLELEGYCDLCSVSLETLDHLFFECRFSLSIWEQIKKWLGIRRSTLNSAIKWLRREARGSSWRSRVKRVGRTVYYIWKARNKAVFEATRTPYLSVIHQIKTQVYKIMFLLYPVFPVL